MLHYREKNPKKLNLLNCTEVICGSKTETESKASYPQLRHSLQSIYLNSPVLLSPLRHISAHLL